VLAQDYLSKTCCGMVDRVAGNFSALKPWLRWMMRLVGILMVAAVIGWTLNRIEIFIERSAQPAGFPRGVLQGALMPMSFPNLLVGNDVTIYSARNNGRPYKLGYTFGVNICGAFFFGCFFWRVHRWRQQVRQPSES
jgi:hypothetical protein